MKPYEIEQLKNDIDNKVAILKREILTGNVPDGSANELLELYEDYKENGASLIELKLFYDDIKLELNR